MIVGLARAAVSVLVQSRACFAEYKLTFMWRTDTLRGNQGFQGLFRIEETEIRLECDSLVLLLQSHTPDIASVASPASSDIS